MRRKRKPALAIAALVAIGAAATVWAMSGHPARIAVPTPAATSVPLNGKVARLLVHEGDIVEKGKLIAELDSTGYEAELKETAKSLRDLQTQTQEAIKPMQALPGITGWLPRSVPQPDVVQVPTQTSTQTPPKPVATKPKGADLYKAAIDSQRQASDALGKATQDLAKATAAVSDAQKARDALRPKVTQAEADAMQADKKADGSKDLLDAGAISPKRAEELLADKESTKKALDALKSQVDEADQALLAAQAAQQAAHGELDKATAALKTADDGLAKAGEGSATSAVAAAPAQPKPLVKMETKLVMRRMPLVSRGEGAPAIPLKVFVDEKAMQSSQRKLADLEQRIETLKARISDCKVFAPAAGRIHIDPSGTIWIQR